MSFVLNAVAGRLPSVAGRVFTALHRRTHPARCPACAADGPKELVSPRWPGYWLRCGECGLVFVGNRMPPGVYRSVVESAHLLDGYQTRQTEDAGAWRRWKRHTYRELGLLPWRALGIDGRRAVEFGAAEGKQSVLLRRLGFDPVAVEPNLALARACREAGIRTRCAYFEDTRLPDGAFSLAVGTHVLEHLLRPGAALAEPHRLLRPCGALLLEVPTSVDTVHPEHLCYFDRPSLDALLRRRRFDPRAWFSYRDQVFGLDNLAVLALRRT